MLRKLDELNQFVGNIRYYLNEGYSFKSAWFFATITIPS
jgi:hypothetical protein